MAPQPQKEDLVRIGNEGFAMVDDIHERLTRISLPSPDPIPKAHHHQIHYHLHHQQYHYQHYYQAPQVVTVRERVIRQPCLYQQQVPQVVTVKERVIRQPCLYQQQVPQVVTVKEPAVIDSNQAAKLYGGTVIVEYGKRKPAHRAS